MRVTRWDVNVLTRAAAITAVALVVAWLVTSATDEGGVAWGERAGRTLPLTPLCAGIGTWGALASVRARGEALALEALGRSQEQITLAAVAGAALVALTAAAAIGALRTVDVAGFYPTAPHPTSWHWSDGGFVDAAQGLRVDPDGTPVRIGWDSGRPNTAAIPPHGRTAAALATALAGLALPMMAARALLAHPGRTARVASDVRVKGARASAFLGAAAAVICSLALFQAAAAGRASALLAAAPPAVLLIHAAWRYRGQS